MKIEVKNNSVTYYLEGSNHILDFGKIPFKGKAIAEIKIISDKKVNLEKTCGCTTISPNDDGNATIEYTNTNLKGFFVKSIEANLGNKIEIIKIKGTVV